MSRAVDPAGRYVRLIDRPARPPSTPAERLLVRALSAGRRMPYGALLDRAAEDAYRAELGSGACAADIGVFGPALFVSEVARAIEAGAGVLWQIETLR